MFCCFACQSKIRGPLWLEWQCNAEIFYERMFYACWSYVPSEFRVSSYLHWQIMKHIYKASFLRSMSKWYGWWICHCKHEQSIRCLMLQYSSTQKVLHLEQRRFKYLIYKAELALLWNSCGSLLSRWGVKKPACVVQVSLKCSRKEELACIGKAASGLDDIRNEGVI